MNKKILFSIAGLISLSSFAQVVPNIDWVNYKSDRSQISNVPSAIDANNNAFITGYMFVTPSNANANTVKYDPNGTELWTASYDNGGFDNSKAIVLDAAGNSYITGESDGSGTGRDIITIKYSPSGTQLWAMRYNGAANGNDVGNSIVLDNSGDVYVTGYITNGSGNRDYVTLKYNSSGVLQFAVNYAGAGNQNDEAVAIGFNNNRLYVTGTAVNAGGNSDLVTLRLNPNNGSTVWVKSENGTANTNDIAYALLPYNNDIVVVGQLNNNVSGNDYFTARYNGNNGTTIWSQSYDFVNTSGGATALTADATGRFAVTGVVNNMGVYEYHTVLYSNNGIQLWVNKVSTGLTFTSALPQIAVDQIANHFYVCGQKNGVGSDILVYQITPGGNKSWEETFNGAQNGTDAAVDLVVNSLGVIYVAGASLNSNAKFDYTTIRISQTPVAFPPDFANEASSKTFTYFKQLGQIMSTSYTPANSLLYATLNHYPDVYIEKNSYYYVFQVEDTIPNNQDSIERIAFNFLGSNPFAKHYNYSPKGVPHNYYLGHASSPAITDVKGNERILVPNYYPNIDLHYYSNKNGIKYYLVVKPGAGEDPLKPIRINIDGANNTSINGNGKLFIDGGLGDITLEKPIAYQVNMAQNVVPLMGSANWVSLGGNNYGLSAPAYNPMLPLVIQIGTSPVVTPSGVKQNLDYSTYYGGSANDVFNDVATATNGDRYVTGYTTSGVFPPVNSLNFYSGSNDCVILKYTADDTLRYATFQGGAAQDQGNTIAINSLNEVFVGGQTFSTDMFGLNVTGATNQFNNGGLSSPFKADGFISKLVSVTGPSDNTLVWRRYFGGSGSETINSIFIDGADNFYIAGYSSSFDCPVVNAFKSTLSPTTAANPSNTDAIFGKFSSALVAQWITYYGGSATTSTGVAQTDWGYDIVVDNSGNVIGCGLTDATNLSTTNTTGNSNTFFDNTYGGGTSTDGFIVRYNSNGNAVDFSSYFGGTGSDAITRLVFKSNLNELYFAGNAGSATNFPIFNKAGATNSSYSAGGSTSFLGYTDGGLTRQWCSFYGRGQVGIKRYSTFGLSVDNSGLVYLSGYTDSDTLQSPITTPTTGVYVDNVRTGDDGFVAIYAPNKSLFHSHYFGGLGNDRILNSAIALNQKLYVTGYASSTDFPVAYTPTTATLIDSTYNGGQDGFISRFDLATYQIIGVEEFDFKNNALKVFPNPTSNGFTIEIQEETKDKLTIAVYNVMGQQIFEKPVKENNIYVDCSSWSAGVYFIHLKNNTSQKTFKLIKQ